MDKYPKPKTENRKPKKNADARLICQVFLMMTALFCSTNHLHAATISHASHSVGMPNPAAVYCNVMGGDMVIHDTPAGEMGLCVFPDMTVCEAWDFVGGTCGQNHSICAYYGLDEITLRGGRFSKYSNYCMGNAGIIGDALNMIDFDKESSCAAMGKNTAFHSDTPIKERPDFPDVDIEPVFSWRNYKGKNWVTPVKAQLRCGSCWAFATVATIEAHYNIFSDWSSPVLVDRSLMLLSQRCCKAFHTQPG